MVGINHSTVVVVPDDGVKPVGTDEWNDDHVITGDVDFNGFNLIDAGNVAEVITDYRDYYVRTDGSDSNDGLTDSASGAFLSIQAAFDAAAVLGSEGIGGGYWHVRINVGAGTFDLGGFYTICGGPFGHQIRLIGSGVASTFFINGGLLGTQCLLDVSDFTVTPGGGRYGVAADHYGYVFVTGTVKVIGTTGAEKGIGGSADSHMILSGTLQLQGDFSYGMFSGQHGQVYVFSGNIDLLSSPTFASGFIGTNWNSPIVWRPGTVTGTAVGKTFHLENGSQIIANATVPGTVSGTGNGFSTITDYSGGGSNEVMYIAPGSVFTWNNGDVTLTHSSNALTMAGGAFVHGSPPQFPSYTVTGVPSASPAGQMAYISNESGGAVMAFSDATNWRRVTDRNVIS